LKETVPDTEKTEFQKQIENLTKQTTDLQKKIQEKEESEKQYQERLKRKDLKEKLEKSLTRQGERKILAKDYVINGLLNDGEVFYNDDNEPVFKTQDGEKPLQEGIETFISNNPDIVTEQKPGGGEAPTSNEANDKQAMINMAEGGGVLSKNFNDDI